jgi:heme exporter protein A
VSDLPAIRIEGLSRYYGERAALEDVSFDLATGQTLVVLGSNGAGKSTLLRVLATLLRPHAGDISVLGHELPEDSWAVRGRVGLIGHDAMLYRDLTARENLCFTAKLHGVDTATVDDALASVDLQQRADEPVRNFSKGMTQRLSVARALLPRPELLLLDEPLANLDPRAAQQLDPLIGKSANTTRVIVTHDIDYGLDQADVALGLVRGEVEWFKPAAEVSAGEAKELYR